MYFHPNPIPELCSKFMGCGKMEKTFGSTQIDTFAVFKHNNQTIINLNDCPFELAEATIKQNRIDIKYIPSKENIADIFTKAMNSMQQLQHASALWNGIRSKM